MNNYLSKTAGWIWVARFVQNLGYEAHPWLTWRVGDRMQVYYKRETGHQPETALCPKTDGSGGTQQHAVYPPVEKWLKAMRKFTEEVLEELRLIGIELSRQMDLFSDRERKGVAICGFDDGVLVELIILDGLDASAQS